MEELLLSRIQFALNISFHILFPTITISLAWFLLFFKIKHNRTGDAYWMQAYQFWVKIFALSFALGVVSGVTMSFQFGTNWPGFMETVGNIAGPLLGYEVLTAFFLEATFLAIMLFGQKKVSNRMHTIATFLVAAGTTFSAFWILALDSWMQTPQGFEMIDGVAHPTSWFEIIFNPSFPYRMVHMLLASGLTASFVVAGISAYRILKGDQKLEPKRTLKVALLAAAMLIPLQVFVGDAHGLNTYHYQPAKVAAMEGLWESEAGADFRLFAIPDKETRSNHFEIKIPYATGLILNHNLTDEVKGLNEFETEPPMAAVFYSFRVMLMIGGLMLLFSWWFSWRLHRNGELKHWQLRALMAMTFSGWVATLAGWYVTEIGRQPWIVTDVLSVSDAVTTQPMANVGISLTLYALVYGGLLIAYFRTIFLLARKAAEAPESDMQNFGDDSFQPLREEAYHA